MGVPRAVNPDDRFAPFHPPATNLVDRLRYWSAQQPSEVAFYFAGDKEDYVKWTYAELDRRARAIASQLTALGMRGKRALLLYPPGLDFVAGFFGCLFAGAVAVPAYPPRRNRNAMRIQSISDDAQATVVLSVQEVVERVESLLDEAPHLRQLDWLATDQMPLESAGGWQMPELTGDTLAVLQYTSGSTGAPKGVMLTHANLMHNCGLITYGFEPDRAGVGLTWLPTYHDMGLVGGVLKPVFIGRPNVLMSPLSFLQKPIRWLRGISRYRVTISGGPNFAYELCNEKITDEECAGLDLSTWDVAFNGAEPIRAETLRRFTEKFSRYGFHATTHYPCYGMAETTLIITGGAKQDIPVVKTFDSRALEDHRVALASAGEKDARSLVGCGRALPGMQVLIVDAETHVPLRDDQIGEIWVAGPSVGQGYWNRPEETRQTFHARLADDKGPYLRTGDLGFLRDGELFVTGRLKDLIIVRGRNLYPQDLEQTVEQSHPALRGGDCAAFSVDVDNEERLVIVQEIDRQHRGANTDEIIAAIRQAVLQQHEVSVYTVALLRMGKLPKTSSGKIQRRACRDAFLSTQLEFIARWTDGQKAPAPPGASAAPSRARQTAGSRRSGDEIQDWLVGSVAARLKQPPAEINVHAPFSQFGLDSLALVNLSGDLEAWLGHPVSPTLLYEYPTIAEFSRYLSDPQLGMAESPQTSRHPAAHSEPVAVVGIGCRFPGAEGAAAFWKLLQDGVDAIDDIPGDRWDVNSYYDPDPAARGKMYTRRGGFLKQVDQFDPQFFSISPREAVEIDPQQRLLLEVAWETLEDAGQSPDRLAGTATGVFVGLSNCDYARLGGVADDCSRIDAHTATGTLDSIAAGRLAYVLGLNGPCLAIDTACSSSLVAVHLALQSLRKGECRTALAGGVNLILHPSSMVALSKVQALSPEGRCKTFDASADGYVRGEGCGLVLLKRLSDALQDGDRILALIRGSAINHDGKSNGLTAPHGPSQESLLREALSDAGVEAGQISYVEAHGTGTSLGDPIEVNALAAVVCQDRPSTQPLVIGSVKTNIGHLESAAGIASLIKVVLALRHGTIPAHLHFQKPNPYIAWDKLPITVPTATQPWQARNGMRLAGVSSFGFSGTNAHVVLQEAPQLVSATTGQKRPLHLLTLSAKSDAALQELAGRYEQLLTERPGELNDICYTAATGRSHFGQRLAIVAQQPEQFVRALAAAREGREDSALFRGKANEQRCPKIAFLFTGQGAQHAGMGRRLYETQPAFCRAMDECNQILQSELDQPLLSALYGSQATTSRLNETSYAQPALFAVEYALCQLWKSWGIEPDFSLGHSVGEFAAACAAGVFSLEDGLKLIAARARLMQALPQAGQMVAIMADEQTVAAALKASGGNVAIAAVNSPQQTVISGADDAVQAVLTRLEADGVRGKRLTVSHAFHSSLMDPMLDEFQLTCRAISLSPPSHTMVAGVHGRVAVEEFATAGYWRRQAREAVRFADGIAELDKLGAEIYLEVGPKPVLTAAMRQCLPDKNQLGLASLREGRDDWLQLLSSVAELYVQGAPIDWQAFHRDWPCRKATAPHYPFQRQRYWLEESSAGPQPAGAQRRSDGSRKASSDRLEDAMFEVQWQPKSRFSQQLDRLAPEYVPWAGAIAEAVEPEVDRLRSQLSLPRYLQLDTGLEALCAAYARRALSQLGWLPAPGELVEFTSLAAQLRIVPQHRRLFHRLLDILTEDGLLKAGDGRWEVSRDIPPQTDAPTLHASLLSRLPECAAELTLVAACGDRLAEVLCGECDPLSVLFPDGSAALVERLYKDSPFARTLNTLVEETIAQAIERLPAGRSLKILEIGAGTGGTTAQLLPRLPADRTEYLFTDVSELFTRTARQKFRQHTFLRFGVLDIEQDPVEQGFAPGQFDLILAANVLHATQDLSVALCHVRQLLAPHGALVLLEGTRPQRWLDLTFGLTEGWWRFSDLDLRPNHPLMSSEKWIDLLKCCGFESAVSLPQDDRLAGTTVRAPHAVVFAQAAADDHQANGELLLTAARQDRAAPGPMAAADAMAIPTAEPSPASGSWLILADRQGVGEALAEQLEGRGGDCVLVFAGDEYEQVDSDHFLCPAETEPLCRVLASGWPSSQRTPCRGVIHLWSLDAPSPDQLTVGQLEASQALGCGGALAALQAVMSTGMHPSPQFWFVTKGAQPVGEHHSLPGLAQSPLWGLGRVLAEEQPACWGGLVDLDPDQGAEQAVASLLTEILDKDDEDQVAYRSGQRYVARLTPRPELSDQYRPLRWRIDATYLISGGLGDLGLRVAEWMARHGARRLVLFGRSALPPRGEWDLVAQQDPRWAARIAALRQLESLGAEVHTASVDVADESQMAAFLEQLKQDGWPPIRGVVHCAGVAEAMPLSELDSDGLARLLRPKVNGVWLLHRLLADARLDFFVCFSSAATFLGSPLLGSYAAANTFLDAITHYRRALGKPSLSVNWGFWSDVGMVARSQREIGRGFAPQGMQSFTPEQGLAAMQHLLEQGAVQTAVMPVDWSEWSQFHPRAAQAPLLAHLTMRDADSAESAAGSAPALDRRTLLSAPASEREQLLQSFLTGRLSQVLRIPASELDVNQPLNNLGIDSLMAVEVRNYVQANLGIMIPVSQLLQDPTVVQLCRSLLAEIEKIQGAAEGQDVAAPFSGDAMLVVARP